VEIRIDSGHDPSMSSAAPQLARSLGHLGQSAFALAADELADTSSAPAPLFDDPARLARPWPARPSVRPGKRDEHTDPHLVGSWDGFAPDPRP
jgi:hypothetical protein